MATQEDAIKLSNFSKKLHGALPDIMHKAVESGDYSEVDRATDMANRVNSLHDQMAGQLGGAATGNEEDLSAVPPPSANLNAQSFAPTLPASAAPSASYFPRDMSIRPNYEALGVPAPGETKRTVDRNNQDLAFVAGLPKATLETALDYGRAAREGIVGAAKRVVGYGEDRSSYTPAELNQFSGTPEQIAALDVAPAQKVNAPMLPSSPSVTPGGAWPPMSRGQMAVEGASTGTSKEEPVGTYSDRLMKAAGQELPDELLSNDERVNKMLASDRILQASGSLVDVAPGSNTQKVIGQANQEFNGDPNALLKNVANTTKPLQSDADREFLRRVQLELGPRPERGSFEKVMMALAVGLGGLTRAWATGRYGGVPLDFNADIRDYDAKKRQIAGQVYGQQAAQQKAAISGTSLPAKMELLKEKAAASERIANIHANAALLGRQMALATQQQRTAVLPLQERKHSLANENNKLARMYENAVQSGLMKPEQAEAEYEGKSKAYTDQIAAIDAEIAKVINGR